MPQKSFNVSVEVSEQVDRSYLGSIDPVLDRTFQGSMVSVIQPERTYRGAVQLVPEGNYRGFNGSVYAFFTPITPDRQIFGSVRAVSVATQSKIFSGSVVRVAPTNINQNYQASVFKSLQVSKTHQGSVVARQEAIEKLFTATLRTMPFESRTYLASAVLRATLEKLFTASVRPANVLSGGELSIYEDAVNYLIPIVLERDANTAQIAALTARNAFLNDDIARVLAILLDIDNKPSVTLNVVNPNSGLRRTGGETITLLGNFYIPTCLIRLKQGVTDFGTFPTVETAMTQVTFTTPDFTSLVGIVLTSPIEVSVENPNGEESESLTFTLGPT